MYVLPLILESILALLTESRCAREKTVPLLLSYLICRLWARYLPNVSMFGVSLNPGPFTIKEHVLITIMASVGGGSAYAVSAIKAVGLRQLISLSASRPMLLPSKGPSTISTLALPVGFWSSTRFSCIDLLLR